MHSIGDIVEQGVTTKNKPLLATGGQCFTVHRRLADNTFFCFCAKRYSKGCKARIRVRDGLIVSVFNAEHTHLPTPGEFVALRTKSRLNEMAVTTNMTTRSVLDAGTVVPTPRRENPEATRSMNLEEEAHLPRNSSLKRTIQRKRQAVRDEPPLPQDGDFNFEIPSCYAEFEDGRSYILADEGRGGDRVLVMGSMESVAALSHARRVFSDGTFKVVPAPFKQLYSIACETACNHHFTAIQILFGRAHPTRSAYAVAFDAVRALAPQFRPETWIADFEMAAWQGIQEIWGIGVSGCLFHLGQSVWRELGEQGLQSSYRDNTRIRRFVQSLSALALVPPDQVVDAFEELASQADFPEELQGVFEYFERVYVGYSRYGRYYSARFPIPSWNYFDDAVGPGRSFRTNNDLEGEHHALLLALGARSGLWEFLEKLKKMHQSQVRKLQRGELGETVQRRRGNLAVDARITSLARDFANRTRISYILAQSNNLGAKN